MRGVVELERQGTYAPKISVAWSATTSKKRSEETWRSVPSSCGATVSVRGALDCGRWPMS